MVCSDLEQQSDNGLYQYGFRVVADTTFLHRLRGGNLKKGTVHNDKNVQKTNLGFYNRPNEMKTKKKRQSD